MELWQSFKNFYWPFSHPGKKEISAEGQAELKEKMKAWKKGQEYQEPRNIWREHSDNLIRQHNRRLLLPVIGKYIRRSLWSGLMLVSVSYL